MDNSVFDELVRVLGKKVCYPLQAYNGWKQQWLAALTSKSLTEKDFYRECRRRKVFFTALVSTPSWYLVKTKGTPVRAVLAHPKDLRRPEGTIAIVDGSDEEDALLAGKMMRLC